jgi:hypothetical protein
MNAKIRNIPVDSETADLLEARAEARGMTLAELLADIANSDEISSGEVAELRAKGRGPWSPEGLEEDALRLAEFERTRVGVPWDEIKAWMETWGTSAELPPPIPRKL